MPDRLANAEKARINPRKLRDYALNPEHESGRYKAAFFAQMGYTSGPAKTLPNWSRSSRHQGRKDLAVDSALTLLETVIITANFPDEQVLAGDLGTIVEIYTDPSPAYEVEFVNPDGSTRALLTLTSDQIRKIAPADVLTTRPLLVAA